MRRVVLTSSLLLPLMAACAQQGPRMSGEEAARSAGCRTEAERVITRRDRGLLMRAEESESRGGTSFGGGVPMGNSATQTDSLAQRFELGRMTNDCVRANTPAAPPAAAGPRGS